LRWTHTGRVLSLSKLHERPESDAANNCNDETDTKHGHDLEFLFLRHVQFGQHGQRQNQNSQVEEDLNAASNEAEQMYVDAARSGRIAPPTVPKEADGHALEDHSKCVSKSEAGNESHQNPDSQARLLVDHDAEIECENRELA